MRCDNHSSREDTTASPWWKTRSGIVMCGFMLLGGFYLVTEHTAHLYGFLPFLFILACPLMHLFHHHGPGKGPSGSSPAKVAIPSPEQGNKP